MNIGDRVKVINDFTGENKYLGQYGTIYHTCYMDLGVNLDDGQKIIGVPGEFEKVIPYIVSYTDMGIDKVFVAKDHDDLTRWLENNMESVKVNEVHEIGRKVDVVETRTYSVK